MAVLFRMERLYSFFFLFAIRLVLFTQTSGRKNLFSATMTLKAGLQSLRFGTFVEIDVARA